MLLLLLAVPRLAVAAVFAFECVRPVRGSREENQTCFEAGTTESDSTSSFFASSFPSSDFRFVSVLLLSASRQGCQSRASDDGRVRGRTNISPSIHSNRFSTLCFASS